MNASNNISKEDVEQIIDLLAEKSYLCSRHLKFDLSCDICFLPVLIGDVLQHMKLKAGQIHNDGKERENILDLVLMWGSCEKHQSLETLQRITSLSLSLQQIVKESGWEYRLKKIEHLKSPQAHALFELLGSLFLK